MSGKLRVRAHKYVKDHVVLKQMETCKHNTVLFFFALFL